MTAQTLIVTPLKARRPRPWQRWSNWVVTSASPIGSSWPGAVREAETGRHVFRWWARLIAAGVRVGMVGGGEITQVIETRRAVR